MKNDNYNSIIDFCRASEKESRTEIVVLHNDSAPALPDKAAVASNAKSNSLAVEMDLKNAIRQAKINQTVVCLRNLMATQCVSPDAAMQFLQIPRKERKAYRAILTNNKQTKSK